MFAQTEVYYLNPIIVRPIHYIFWLQIPMCDALAMQMIDGQEQ